MCIVHLLINCPLNWSSLYEARTCIATIASLYLFAVYHSLLSNPKLIEAKFTYIRSSIRSNLSFQNWECLNFFIYFLYFISYRTTPCSGTTYYREFPITSNDFFFDRFRHEEDITLTNRIVDENRWEPLAIVAKKVGDRVNRWIACANADVTRPNRRGLVQKVAKNRWNEMKQ